MSKYQLKWWNFVFFYSLLPDGRLKSQFNFFRYNFRYEIYNDDNWYLNMSWLCRSKNLLEQKFTKKKNENKIFDSLFRFFKLYTYIMPKTRGFRSHTSKIFLQSPVFTRLYQIKKKKKKQPKNILMCVSLPMKNEHLQHEKHEIDETHTSAIVLTHIHTQHM